MRVPPDRVSRPETDGTLCAIVLAAGQGTRMRSPLPKVLHRVGGRTMIDRVLDVLAEAGFSRRIVVVGFGRRQVEREIKHTHPGVERVRQDEPLGTGDAVRAALTVLGPGEETVGVFSGDTPLLRAETVRALRGEHLHRQAAATLLTAHLADPSGYGRVVRDHRGLVARVVEERDADQGVRSLREINAGAYLYRYPDLAEGVAQLRNDNVQGEYYLTDTIAWLCARGRPVAAVTADGDGVEVLGVNTPRQLRLAEQLLTGRGGER